MVHKDKKNVLIMDGLVLEALPNFLVKVKLDNDMEILGYISGKIRKYHIRILQGDKVRVELSPYDIERCRVIFRY